jgi:hypothetical protein
LPAVSEWSDFNHRHRGALRFGEITVSVRLNMIEPHNGHAPTTSADKYTGAIILRTRPHTYKRVVRLLSEGVPAIRIARDCKVTERSVAAIAKREREEITERKKSLAGLMSNIAEIGGANVERKIGKASVRDAIIGTGIAVDKMLALTGQTPVSTQVAVIQMPTPEQNERRRRTDYALDEITRLLHKPEPLTVKEELMIKTVPRRRAAQVHQRRPG